jgi:hypothetical protein
MRKVIQRLLIASLSLVIAFTAGDSKILIPHSETVRG